MAPGGGSIKGRRERREKKERIKEKWGGTKKNGFSTEPVHEERTRNETGERERQPERRKKKGHVIEGTTRSLESRGETRKRNAEKAPTKSRAQQKQRIGGRATSHWTPTILGKGEGRRDPQGPGKDKGEARGTKNGRKITSNVDVQAKRRVPGSKKGKQTSGGFLGKNRKRKGGKKREEGHGVFTVKIKSQRAKGGGKKHRRQWRSRGQLGRHRHKLNRPGEDRAGQRAETRNTGLAAEKK